MRFSFILIDDLWFNFLTNFAHLLKDSLSVNKVLLIFDSWMHRGKSFICSTKTEKQKTDATLTLFFFLFGVLFVFRWFTVNNLLCLSVELMNFIFFCCLVDCEGGFLLKICGVVLLLMTVQVTFTKWCCFSCCCCYCYCYCLADDFWCKCVDFLRVSVCLYVYCVCVFI